MMKWHTKTAEEVLKELNTSTEGLSDSEAAKRIAEYGRNELQSKKKMLAAFAISSVAINVFICHGLQPMDKISTQKSQALAKILTPRFG